MGDLDDLKKALKKQSDSINQLIETEFKTGRLKQEMASNERILSDLHTQIEAAKNALQATQEQAEKTIREASKESDHIKTAAKAIMDEAEGRLTEAKKIERLAQAKQTELEDATKKAQAQLAELQSKHEKLRAAMV